MEEEGLLIISILIVVGGFSIKLDIKSSSSSKACVIYTNIFIIVIISFRYLKAFNSLSGVT